AWIPGLEPHPPRAQVRLDDDPVLRVHPAVELRLVAVVAHALVALERAADAIARAGQQHQLVAALARGAALRASLVGGELAPREGDEALVGAVRPPRGRRARERPVPGRGAP